MTNPTLPSSLRATWASALARPESTLAPDCSVSIEAESDSLRRHHRPFQVGDMGIQVTHETAQLRARRYSVSTMASTSTWRPENETRSTYSNRSPVPIGKKLRSLYLLSPYSFGLLPVSS